MLSDIETIVRTQVEILEAIRDMRNKELSILLDVTKNQSETLGKIDTITTFLNNMRIEIEKHDFRINGLEDDRRNIKKDMFIYKMLFMVLFFLVFILFLK